MSRSGRAAEVRSIRAQLLKGQLGILIDSIQMLKPFFPARKGKNKRFLLYARQAARILIDTFRLIYRLVFTSTVPSFSYHPAIQLSRNRICSSVWNQCSPFGMTVSSAPIRFAKADIVSSEVRLSCAPYKMRVGICHEIGCTRT